MRRRFRPWDIDNLLAHVYMSEINRYGLPNMQALKAGPLFKTTEFCYILIREPQVVLQYHGICETLACGLGSRNC